MRVMRARGSNPGEVEPLTGIDGGQGFLKVGLVLNEPTEDTQAGVGERSKYHQVCVFFISSFDYEKFRECVPRFSSSVVSKSYSC